MVESRIRVRAFEQLEIQIEDTDLQPAMLQRLRQVLQAGRRKRIVSPIESDLAVEGIQDDLRNLHKQDAVVLRVAVADPTAIVLEPSVVGVRLLGRRDVEGRVNHRSGILR